MHGHPQRVRGAPPASCTPNPSSPYFTVSPAGTIVATYNADANFSASVGSTPTPAFSQATPVAAISTSRQSSAAGATVTYTATFADPNGGLVAPTGPVTFTDGVTTVCSLSSPSSHDRGGLDLRLHRAGRLHDRRAAPDHRHLRR